MDDINKDFKSDLLHTSFIRAYQKLLNRGYKMSILILKNTSAEAHYTLKNLLHTN